MPIAWHKNCLFHNTFGKSCKKFIEQIRLDAIVSKGGALVRIGGEIIYHMNMDKNTSNDLLLKILSSSNIG